MLVTRTTSRTFALVQRRAAVGNGANNVLVRLNGTTATASTGAGAGESVPPPQTQTQVTTTTSNGTLTPQSAKSITVSSTSNTNSPSPSSSSTSETQKTEDVAKITPPKKASTFRYRPSISLTNPRKWTRPVGVGKLPVYDEALKVIREDSKKIKAELEAVRAEVKRLEGATEKENVKGELEELRKKEKILEIQSEINLPQVRWGVANGMADMTKPVHRHLAEQKWRKQGDLDLLMERIYQMNVVPDVLPAVHPSIDLRLTFPEPPPSNTYLRTRTRRKHKPVEPGVYLVPEQTRRAPRMYATVFHPEERYYTLVMLDPDVPDPENQSFTTYLHWMVPNIKLSAGSSGALTQPTPVKYVPPHPQKGSPYHRYCLFLLPHVNATEGLPPAAYSALTGSGNEGVADTRRGFNLREFSEQWGLDGGNGGGAFMWREVWDESVSDIYRHTLKQDEPVYGIPPQRDAYAEVKSMRKYVKY